MKKNMYSLILAEDVVDEIDKMADAEGTNRVSYQSYTCGLCGNRHAGKNHNRHF